MPMKPRIVVGLGEILWDLLPSGKRLGGAPANFAYHVSAFGLDGMALSATGRDELGREIVATLDSAGLSHSLQLNDRPTGTVRVTLGGAGIPEYDIVEDVAWDRLRFDDAFAGIAAECSCVCFGTLAQRSPVSRECIRSFLDAVPEDSLRIYDINLRQRYYSEELIRESMSKADILKLNDDELKMVSGMFGYGGAMLPADICRRLLEDSGLKLIILTCGTKGSYVVAADKVLFHETPVVNVVDTVGAGDSFTATFCAALLKGHDPEAALDAAVRVSAFVCTREGAMPELPEELRNLL